MADPVSFRLPDDLLAAVRARADELGQTQTVFVKRALEAALRDDTPRPSPAGATGQVRSGEVPARPAAATLPGASRPPASPRTPCIPGCSGGDNHKAKCPNHPKFT